MIEALISGERRGSVMADLAKTRLRTAGKMASLPVALTGRFTDHHALMCRLHLDRIKIFDDAVKDLDGHIAPLVARYPGAAALLRTLPGFGDVIVAGWLGVIGPAPHQHFATAARLASWAAICPGNYMSAKKSKGGRTGDGGACIKPLLIQAAWAARQRADDLQGRLKQRLEDLEAERQLAQPPAGSLPAPGRCGPASPRHARHPPSGFARPGAPTKRRERTSCASSWPRFP